MCWGWSGSLQLPVYHDFPPNTPRLKFSDVFQLHKNVVAEKPLKCASCKCSGLLYVPLSASICVKLFTTLYVSGLHNSAFSIPALVPGAPLLHSAQRWCVQSKMWLTILGWMQKCQSCLSCVQDRGMWIFLASPCCSTAHRWPFGFVSAGILPHTGTVAWALLMETEH